MTRAGAGDEAEIDLTPRQRVAVALVLATAVAFRVMDLGRIPGLNGDEGWWGVQATHWARGEPYLTRTTSGNPIDPFLLVPVGLLHVIAPPSFALLRTVPAAANLLALALGWWLVRRIYGTATAWIQTIALAILPTAIAHSRFCQDPSQSIPWTGLVVCLSLLAVKEPRRARLYAALAIAAFPIAVWTHPTNVFAVTFVGVALAAAAAPLVPATRRGRIAAASAGLAVVAAVAVIALPWLATLARSIELLDKPWLAVAAARLTRPTSWLEFAVNYARLFDGVTIYHYFVDPRLASPISDAGVVAAGLAIAWGLVTALGRSRSPIDAPLLVAWSSMGLLFFLFAGPEALRPHAERWGLCLIAPATIVMARGIAVTIASTPWRGWAIAAWLTLAAGLLGSFYLNYFRQFETVGGRSHIAFVTAPIEPKQQALALVLNQRTGQEPAVIVAQQWWTYWPLAYLAGGQPNVSVRMTLPEAERPDADDAARRGCLFIVEFADTPELTRATTWLASRGYRATTTIISAADGRALLTVLQARQ